MKIIHCADFHLDAPMHTNLTPEKARLRRHELLQAFGRMADYAVEHRVEAILIAGDLFDSSAPRQEVRDYVIDTIQKCPGIHFYYLRGNHDEHMAFPNVPENLHLFSHSWQYYRCGEVTIYGAEGCTTLSDYDGLDPDPTACNLVLLHGQAGSAAGADLVPLQTLRGRGIDYLALGHIHSYQYESLDARGNWAYAGCPEGRGFDECGEKGFVLLDIQYKQVSAEFVPFAVRTIHRCTMDMTGAHLLTHIEERFHAAVDPVLCSDDMVELVVVGELEEGQGNPLQVYRDVLQKLFFMSRVTDRTRLAIDPSRYRDELSLKGAFFRLVEADTDLSPEDRSFVLRAGFDVLNGIPLQV